MKEAPSNFFGVKFFKATEMEHYRIEFILFFFCGISFLWQIKFLGSYKIYSLRLRDFACNGFVASVRGISLTLPISHSPPLPLSRSIPNTQTPLLQPQLLTHPMIIRWRQTEYSGCFCIGLGDAADITHIFCSHHLFHFS